MSNNAVGPQRLRCVDGMEIKCRLDFGAKAIDWRGPYKNPGA